MSSNGKGWWSATTIGPWDAGSNGASSAPWIAMP
jgi:hypothetical protein